MLVTASKATPDDLDLRYEVAMMAEKLNRMDEVEKLLRGVIAEKPDFEHAYNALGYALADRSRRVHCLISDGECGEGSIWEALRFIYEAKLDNLEVYVNVNGMIAYDFIDKEYIINRLRAFLPRINIRETSPPDWSFAKGILTHYYVLKPEDLDQL